LKNIERQTLTLNTINFEKLNFQADQIMLDVGCGLGRHSLLAFRDYPIEVHATDLDFKDLFSAKNRSIALKNPDYQGEVYFTQSDGYFLPYPSDSFDKVICSEVLEHVPNYQTLVGELIRVLKPGGILALSVPKYFPEKLCWLLSEDYPELAGHVRIFSGNQLCNTVIERGLALLDKHSAHAIHTPYWWIRCIFFRAGENSWLAKRYQEFMNWHQFSGPKILHNIEIFLNPILGKSNVYYFLKP